MVSFLATSNSLIQLSVPDRLRGRVMSVYTLVFLGFTPFGNSFIGILADAIGTINAVAISAMICIVASIIFLKAQIRKSP
jgi:MFS-type transporter involved in bile tolerance (Atg22 family)